jgi:SP family general alpha glucoside:H+ symporter-like MFS transporter
MMSRGIGRRCVLPHPRGIGTRKADVFPDRTLYIVGLIGLSALLFTAGFLGLVPKANKSDGAMATGVLMICWAAVYQLTVGSVAYSIVGEIPSRRLLIKTVVLGRQL